MQLGDKISSVATPIARALNLDCIDPQTNDLKSDSPCAQRKQMLNEGRYSDAVYDFFHRKQTKQKEQ